jgi:transposase InsO family protein
MAADVDRYVASCDACQRNKPSQQLTPGPLMPLPIPERPCMAWTQDAVTGLPKTRRGHDAIQVYVERLAKLKHFAASRSTDGAVEMAAGFVHNVVRLHGVPESVISDRDPRITAHYYAELSRLMGTKLSMSTARHPQTDGQSEREIRTLVTALRAFCNDHQDDWDDYLDMLELGFNSAVQASTLRSPHELVFGVAPRLPIDVAIDSLTPRVPAAVDRAARMKEAFDFARSQLVTAQERQARNADRHRRELRLGVGDQVLLTTEGLQLRNFTNKLCSRFIGPFPITKVVNANAFELKLPPQLQALHPVFNISRLKPYVPNNSKFATRPQRFDRPPPEADADTNGDAVFEVERIVAARGRGRSLRYLVAWKGYPPEENTWVPRSNLSNAREALAEFEATHGRVPVPAGQ